MNINGKTLSIYGIAIIIIQLLVSCGIFVRFSDMVAYAAPKHDIETIRVQLTKIENKLDKIIMGY